MELKELTDIAIKAAHAAGKVIQQHMHENVAVETKQGGENYASQVVTEVDRTCEQVILSHLLPTCDNFDIAMLTEETEDDGGRFENDFFWCVDPIDGTLAFIDKQPGFSVSIALIAKDGTPCIGVVYDPSTNTLYHAIKGHGAYVNGSPFVVKHSHDYLTYVTDKKLVNDPRAKKIEPILKELVNRHQLSEVKELHGRGAVLNAIQVVENGPACMFKLPKKEIGGGSIWDFAATACVFRELGLPATNFKGGRLDLNRKDDTFMNEEGVFFSNLK